MNKAALVLSLALLLPLSSAFAEAGVQATVGVSLHGSAGAGDDQETGEVHATSGIMLDDEHANGTSSAEADEDASATSSTMNHDDEDISAAHRSTVAAFVQSLLRAADRDGGIGAQVRAVAESQNESASTTAMAIAHVEGRNPFLSFLIGTDWKNIGTLRSEIAKTKEDAARLQTAISSTTDASVKANLQAELTALQAEQAKVQAFVDAHEKSFSLFGWFTKLFVNSSTTVTTSASTTSQ